MSWRAKDSASRASCASIFPISEVITGFILETDSFGIDEETGKPNAIYFSGETGYIEELQQIKERVHVMAAVLNLGRVTFWFPIVPLQITMDELQVVRLVREIGADVLVPMHFDGWEHFKEHGKELSRGFKEEVVMERICWATPAEPKVVY